MHNPRNADEGREGSISLWRLDKLMRGELPQPEADALREAVSRSPEAREYLSKYQDLASDLTLAGLRERRKGSSAGGVVRLWEIIRESFRISGLGRAGMALACLLILGLGSLTWNTRTGAENVPGGEASRLRAKGSGSGVRLVIGGVEYDPGQLAQAGPGDTLMLAYRSAGPVRARIWFQEEGGKPAAMEGKAEALSWEAATAWNRAPQRIVLDGEWKRQTVWVVWSSADFSEKEAREAVNGNPSRSDLRADAFRLANSQ